VKVLTELGAELSNEKGNLLSVACKNIIGLKVHLEGCFEYEQQTENQYLTRSCSSLKASD
jgi:hypothetical protein